MFHVVLVFFFAAAMAQNPSCPNCPPQQNQATTSPPITAKINIVFEPKPCTTGNCNSAPVAAPAPVVNAAPCTTGNCPVVSAPVVSNAAPCSSGNCNVVAPAPVIRAPCSNGNCNTVVANLAPIFVNAQPSGCFNPPCRSPIILPSNAPCSGIGCGVRPIFASPVMSNYAPIIRTVMAAPMYGGNSYPCIGGVGIGCGARPCFGNNCNNNNNIGTGATVFGMPDPILTAGGRVIRPQVRIPSSYDNGNPVFSQRRGGFSNYGFGK